MIPAEMIHQLLKYNGLVIAKEMTGEYFFYLINTT